MTWTALLEIIKRAKSHLGDGSGSAALQMLENEVRKEAAHEDRKPEGMGALPPH